MELKLDITDLVHEVGGLIEYIDSSKLYGEQVYSLIAKAFGEGSTLDLHERVEYMFNAKLLAQYLVNLNDKIRMVLTVDEVRKMLIDEDLQVYTRDCRQAVPIPTEDCTSTVKYMQAPKLSINVEVINTNTGESIEFDVHPTGITTIDDAVSDTITETIMKERTSLGL